jgi:HPt (histidine-containing phosphotransfer) domain-containing protein
MECITEPSVRCGDPIDPMIWANLLELMESESSEFLAELIDSTMEETSRQLALIRKANEPLDPIALRHAVHVLRSPSASLGAAPLAALCGEVERNLHDVATAQCRITIGSDGLLSEAERVRTALQARHPRHGG